MTTTDMPQIDPLAALRTMSQMIATRIQDEPAGAQSYIKGFQDGIAAATSLMSLPPSTGGRLTTGLQLAAPPQPVRRRGSREHGLLTLREMEVAILAANGSTRQQIAETLILGEGTVNTYIARIYQRLNVSNFKGIAEWLAAHPEEGPR